MGHTYSNLLVHVVFGTKDRRPTIHDSFRTRLHEYLGGIAREEFGRALQIGGTSDHVHGLILLRTDVAVADTMRASEKRCQEPFLEKRFLTPFFSRAQNAPSWSAAGRSCSLAARRHGGWVWRKARTTPSFSSASRLQVE